jgi:hypothetical protein
MQARVVRSGDAEEDGATMRTAPGFAAADLGYREESFAGSFRQILNHLSGAGAAASRRPH